jgi:hypothetical protein
MSAGAWLILLDMCLFYIHVIIFPLIKKKKKKKIFPNNLVSWKFYRFCNLVLFEMRIIITCNITLLFNFLVISFTFFFFKILKLLHGTEQCTVKKELEIWTNIS